MKPAFALALTVFVLGCESAELTCTVVGCVNALRIEIANPPAGAITVQALAVGIGDSVHTATCANSNECSGSLYLNGFTPATAQLTIITSAGSRQISVTPTYTTTYPNGKACGGECHNGVVKITL